jgi:dihydroorotase
MREAFDLVLTGGIIVNQDGEFQRDLAIKDGRFAAIGDLSRAGAAERVDCRGLHLLPGVIDTHVHFREPGLTHKEDLETGSRSAVQGGVTAVFEMPNTEPPTTNATTFADKLRAARGRMHCDFSFFIGGTHDNVTELAELERLPGSAGIKVFMGSSTGRLLVEDDAGVRAILRAIRRRAAFHAEDHARLEERKGLRRDSDPSSHPDWRDETAALRATTRLLALARETTRRVHVLHVSTAEELEVLVRYRDLATVEVTPQHLTLEAPECYERLGTRAQMNPPLRGPRHRAALWKALADGLVDVLGSDHAPHTLAEKAKPYPASPSGMPGVQMLVPVMLNHVAASRLTLSRFVDLTSAGPARIFGIACKGRIAAGFDADLTVVDLKRQETITSKWIASRCGWTPFDGLKVTGWPVGTFVRGRKVMWQGEITAPSEGAPVRFLLARQQCAG